jgi:hypothetical protein
VEHDKYWGMSVEPGAHLMGKMQRLVQSGTSAEARECQA